MNATTEQGAERDARGTGQAAAAKPIDSTLRFYTLDVQEPDGRGGNCKRITFTATAGQADVMRSTLEGAYEGGLLANWSVRELTVDRDFSGALAFVDGFTSVRNYGGRQ